MLGDQRFTQETLRVEMRLVDRISLAKIIGQKPAIQILLL
jgi:hypothetical protein